MHTLKIYLKAFLPRNCCQVLRFGKAKHTLVTYAKEGPLESSRSDLRSWLCSLSKVRLLPGRMGMLLAELPERSSYIISV